MDTYVFRFFLFEVKMAIQEAEPSSIFPSIDSHTHIIYEKKPKYADFIGDRYLKGSLIGEGSYSKVKDILDAQSLLRKAAKIVSRKKIRKIPNGETNVRREIQILSKISHVNIIKLYHSFQDPIKDKIYLILEYCLGDLQTLLDSSTDKRFCLWQSKEYFVQLMEGLEYIHSRGIVHKDIKPGNMLITADDILKLTDFGVAEELSPYEANDDCRLAQGAPAFQSPEEVTGIHDVWSGFKADIWSAGVSLYNFTTGQYPFEGDCLYQIINSIQNDEVVIPSSLPTKLIDLLTKMLQKIPSKRFSLHLIKRHPWFIESIPIQPELILKFGSYNDKTKASKRSLTVTPYLESLHRVPNENEKQELYYMQGYNRNLDIGNSGQFNLMENNPISFEEHIMARHTKLGGSDQQIYNVCEPIDKLSMMKLDADNLRLANSVEVIEKDSSMDHKHSTMPKNYKSKKKAQSCKQQ